jgi:hypothetical protein
VKNHACGGGPHAYEAISAIEPRPHARGWGRVCFPLGRQGDWLSISSGAILQCPRRAWRRRGAGRASKTNGAVQECGSGVNQRIPADGFVRQLRAQLRFRWKPGRRSSRRVTARNNHRQLAAGLSNSFHRRGGQFAPCLATWRPASSQEAGCFLRAIACRAADRVDFTINCPQHLWGWRLARLDVPPATSARRI